MTAVAPLSGRRITSLAANLGTSEVALITAAQQKSVTLESASFCNTTGTTEREVNFYIKTGTGNVYVWRANPLAMWQSKAIDTLSLVLQPGQSFCVSAESAASGVDVTLTTIESSSSADSAGKSLNELRGL